MTLLNPELDPQFGSYRRILVLAGPLILSQTSVMLMQLVDALFLARHSQDAIAAIGPSAMFFWTALSLFMGLCGYTGTFVAQYMGAARPKRVGAAVWQGIYLSIACGLLVMLMSLTARPVFNALGHDPLVTEMEVQYFQVCCLGAVFFLLAGAMSGFYAGRNDNMVLMAIHLSGALVNAVLDYGLIFGHLGLPKLGMAGAALATVLAHVWIVLCLATIFLSRSHRQQYGTWEDRPLDWPLLGRLVRFGTPAGVRMLVEVGVWAGFLAFVGRLGAEGLAASNIVWRINGMAFFPVIGLSIVVAMLVGQAQGAGRSDLAQKVTWRGMAVGQAWMMTAALLFVLFPQPLMDLFLSGADDPTANLDKLRDMGVILLRFVAVYCLLDGFNILLMSALQGAGDTRWTLWVTALMYAVFFVALVVLDSMGVGLYTLWLAATLFVCLLALVWVYRFRSGRWKTMRVIEHAPPELESKG